MKFVDFQMIDQGEQIVGAGGGRAVRIGHRAAETTTLVRDKPIARPRKCGDLLFPYLAAPGERVEKDHRHSASARVLVIDLRPRNIDKSLTQRFRRCLSRCQMSDEKDD